MRGSLIELIDALSILGIIPAHAGLTASASIGCGAGRDHPRACGAHHDLTLQDFDATGSSPRMRGSQAHDFHDIP